MGTRPQRREEMTGIQVLYFIVAVFLLLLVLRVFGVI